MLTVWRRKAEMHMANQQDGTVQKDVAKKENIHQVYLA